MVKRLLEKPTGYFVDAHEDFIWFGLYYKNEPYAYVAIEVLGTFASLHTEMIKWSHNIARVMQIDWEEIKFLCKQGGIKEVIASNSDVKDKKWPKFIRLFGFDEPKPILASRQEI
jgi:hypothetical protein